MSAGRVDWIWPMLSDTQIARLAAMCNDLRPDWPQASCYTFIARNLAGRGYRDCAVALAWIAADTSTDKPARVLEAGPWWQAAALGGASTGRPPRFAETCRHHPASWAANCAGCRADQLAGEDRPAQPAGQAPPPANLADVRAKLKADQEAYQAKVRSLRAELHPTSEEPA